MYTDILPIYQYAIHIYHTRYYVNIYYTTYIYIYICHILYTLIYIYIYYLLTDRSLASSLVESNRIGRRVDCLLIASYLALALVLNCPDHPEPSRAQSNSHILPADIHTDKIIHTHMYICKYTHIYTAYTEPIPI